MAVFTLEELAKLKGGAAKVAGGGTGWTPEKVHGIITAIRDLAREYNAMRGGAALQRPGQELAQGPPGPGQQVAAPGGVTMAQLYGFAKQVLTNLEAQGYADKTPFEVLQAFPVTIRELKGMIP